MSCPSAVVYKVHLYVAHLSSPKRPRTPPNLVYNRMCYTLTCLHRVALTPRTNGRRLPSMKIGRRSSMNTEVDGCEDEARVTLTPFSGQSWRINLPNHARREFGLNINLPPCPILALFNAEHRQDAHNSHPQHRICHPLARAVSSSEPKSHARSERVVVYHSPMFTEVPLRVEDIGLMVLALFVMDLPIENNFVKVVRALQWSSLTRHWAKSLYLRRVNTEHRTSSRAAHLLV